MSVGVGVIGLGFMGQTHARAYAKAGARLVAVCDADEARRSGLTPAEGNIGGAHGERLFDPAETLATDDLTAFLAAPGLDLVSVCTPTDTHTELATAALRAGKHVVVEKPVALTAAAVRAIADEADRAGTLCMPAMCMRFWPAWAWIREAAASGRHGGVRAARFERLGSAPAWSRAFYADASRSGGALFDLHVHDTDFIAHCFGPPASVRSVGDASHVTTVYRYPGGPAQVVAQGGWLTGALPFRMRATVELEGGVADFELGRDPELAFYPAGEDGPVTPELDPADGWEAELAAMVRAVERGDREPPATMASAAVSTAVLEAELESLRTGEEAAVRAGDA